MNTDDPKLTAFALDELEEPEKSAMAREVEQSPEAQRVVDETREIARVLQNHFAVELANQAATSKSGSVRAAETIDATPSASLSPVVKSPA